MGTEDAARVTAATIEVASKDGDDDELARGATLGRHVMPQSLGRGAMGVVHVAFDGLLADAARALGRP